MLVLNNLQPVLEVTPVADSSCPARVGVPMLGAMGRLSSMGRGDRNGGVHLPSKPQPPKQLFPRSACQRQLVPVISEGVYRTCDGMVGERLDVDEIIMRAVFLQPFAHILLGPEHHWLGQAAQCGAGVVDAIVVTGTALWGVGGEGVNGIWPPRGKTPWPGAHRDMRRCQQTLALHLLESLGLPQNSSIRGTGERSQGSGDGRPRWGSCPTQTPHLGAPWPSCCRQEP